MHAEAAIDFPEEEIDFRPTPSCFAGWPTSAAASTSSNARCIRAGCRAKGSTSLTGRPNSGKSSLLNALAGHDAAIVTEIPGTTRDLVREHLEIGGLPVHIVDTAGLRESADPVEREGVRRTREQLTVADLALLVVDSSVSPGDDAALHAELPADVPVLVVRNKIDLGGDPPGPAAVEENVLNVSALTGAGLDELRAAILARAGFAGIGEGTITARQRHVEVLNRARRHFEAGRRQLTERRAGELLAEELREAQNALAEITGEFGSDDLLGRIFASFCIGK